MPEANVLVLVRQMEASLVVEGSEFSGGLAEKILSTSVRGQVVVVAAELGDLEQEWKIIKTLRPLFCGTISMGLNTLLVLGIVRFKQSYHSL